MIRTIVADKTTAVHAAQAVCAALFARGRTGEGQHIRLSMLDTDGRLSVARGDDPIHRRRPRKRPAARRRGRI